MSSGGSPSVSPSGDDERALEFSEVACAWRPWLLRQISWPLPLNKLKAGLSLDLDLDLGEPAGSCSACSVLRASAATSSPPAGRGGEGRRDVGFSGSGSDEHVEVSEGAPPWLVHASCSAASSSSPTLALGRPPIYTVYRFRRRVHQQRLQVGIFSPAPAYAGRLTTLFFFNLRLEALPGVRCWRVTPPHSQVVRPRRWVAGGWLLALPVGGEGLGLDCFFFFLSRVLCVNCQACFSVVFFEGPACNLYPQL
jgi:hypothetical protein